MYQSGVELRPVQDGDIEYIAANVREADRIEIYESSRRDVAEALRDTVTRSERTAVAVYDGKPEAIFGVGRLSLMSDVGVPWMIGTKALTGNARKVMSVARPLLRRVMQGNEVLRNFVHADNKLAIRWLKSMGFRFSEPIPYGWRGAKFHVFELNKEELDV